MDKLITVELTVDQWSFIVCGLRDCADNMPHADLAESGEEAESIEAMVKQNRELADYIEQRYVGNHYEAMSQEDKDIIWQVLYEGNDKGDLIANLIESMTDDELREVLEQDK